MTPDPSKRIRLAEAAAYWGVRPEALALTGAGEPGHPLYLRADLKPFRIGIRP